MFRSAPRRRTAVAADGLQVLSSLECQMCAMCAFGLRRATRGVHVLMFFVIIKLSLVPLGTAIHCS